MIITVTITTMMAINNVGIVMHGECLFLAMP